MREASLKFRRQKEAQPPFECSQVRAMFLLEQESERMTKNTLKINIFIMMDCEFQKAQWKMEIEGE